MFNFFLSNSILWNKKTHLRLAGSNTSSPRLSEDQAEPRTVNSKLLTERAGKTEREVHKSAKMKGFFGIIS